MTDRWDEELDQALDALRADVPEMEPRAFAAGRARLQVAIGAPPAAAGTREPDDAVTHVLAPDRRRRSPPLRKAVPWIAVAAAVAAVAVGAVAFLPGDATPPGGGPAATAPPKPTAPVDTTVDGRPGEPLPAMPAEPLNTAGELAGKVKDITLKPGEVLYVRTNRTQAAGSAGPGGSDTEELWIPADRDSEWLIRRTASGEIQGRSDKDFEEHRGPGGRFDDGTTVWPEDPAKAAAMSRDPAALYEWLRTRANADLPGSSSSTQSAAQDAIGTVISMLADTTGTVPADLRAALLRTLGFLPGITIDSGVPAGGRSVVSISHVLDDGTYRNEILFDPATGRFVDWRNVAIKPFNGFEPGQVFTAGPRTEAIVSALGERP
jgi:hypothetical protein